jgi:hypothetical protein
MPHHELSAVVTANNCDLLREDDMGLSERREGP